MTSALLYCYLGGWAVVSLMIAVLAPRLQNKVAPAEHPTAMSVVAGAVWPILVVALAEAGAVALATELLRQRPQLLSIDA